jgi:tight adherence protein C
MTLVEIAYLVIVFLFIAGITFAVMRLFAARPTQIRLDKLASNKARTEIEIETNEYDEWERSVSKIVKPFASLSLPSEGWEKSHLRTRFMNAGYRAQSLPIFYFGSKTLLAIILPGLLFAFVGMSRFEFDVNSIWMFLFLMAAIGYYLPNLILSRKIFVRKRDLFENFPDAIDLMTVCVEAGLGLDAAMNKVGEEMHVKCLPLAEELNLVNLEIRAGRSREQAFRNLAQRTGVEEIQGLVAMLIQADRFGTSIAVSLRVHSEVLRTKRRLRAEEAAGKIALKLLFPLIFFLFPALMVVIIGPGAITMANVLFPAMGAQ